MNTHQKSATETQLHVASLPCFGAFELYRAGRSSALRTAWLMELCLWMIFCQTKARFGAFNGIIRNTNDYLE